jgi:hypothetical protein
MKPATARLILIERNALNATNPVKDPITPMDTISAPHVLRPPWARKRACINNAAAVISMLITGPTSIPDIPVPQGWEHVPAVGTGTGIQEMIKTTAAISPTRGLKEMSAAANFFIFHNPHATKGAAMTDQKAAHPKGNIPSERCMAWAFETVSSTQQAVIREVTRTFKF